MSDAEMPAKVMRGTSVRRAGELVRKGFEILLAEREAVPDAIVMKRLEQSLALTDFERSYDPRRSFVPRFERIAQLGAVAPTKAGWMRTEGGLWSLTELGRQAYLRYADPEQFMRAAARRTLRGCLSVHLPAFYSLVGRILYQVEIECRMVRRLGLRQLLRELFGLSMPRQSDLPVQKPLRIVLPSLRLHNLDDLLRYLESLGVEYFQGGHTVYLSGDAIDRSDFGVLRQYYPAGTGLKFMKNPGPIAECGYIHGGSRQLSMIHRRLIYSHGALCLVANLLHEQGVGPRLYDLLEIQCGDQVWTAYAIEHVNGRVPSSAQCGAGLDTIRRLERQGLIKITLPEGFEDEEFREPSCNNNVLMSERGEFRYVDFQNFLIVDHAKYIRQIAARASASTHFGDISLLRGGRYLYQSVPTLRMPGRRDTGRRAKNIMDLARRAGVSPGERVVLDIGCNLGMMMAEYLRMGARWCHGWDTGEITPHAERMLLAIGCTRFSLTGAWLDGNRDLVQDLPEFLRSRLDGCIISYLAVRGTLGWMEALASIPWKAIIYEGHEDETIEQFHEFLAGLRAKVAFEVGPVDSIRDGDCDARTLAILLRK